MCIVGIVFSILEIWGYFEKFWGELSECIENYRLFLMVISYYLIELLIKVGIYIYWFCVDFYFVFMVIIFLKFVRGMYVGGEMIYI